MAILQISVVFRGTWGIYGANILHQPVSKIMKNLRDVLVVPEAARVRRTCQTWNWERFESRLQYCQASQNSTASMHSSHKFYEDWPLTLPDEGSC